MTRKLGARHVINYKMTPKWSEEVLRITQGRGVDHVVDVAGSGTIEESLRSCRKDGLVSVLGTLSEPKMTDLIPMIMLGGINIRGHGGSGSALMLQQLVEFVERHDIHPLIASSYDFHHAVEAFAELKKRQLVGKTVIKT
ncbi:alcohol dehydrogenase [Phlyctema vagabunda]|uniref:Alcohol dehydrogenase n=1 Tax=Phlyctema vagabunda TaxID=108571 RepID=A0ABR4P637_9HELO